MADSKFSSMRESTNGSNLILNFFGTELVRCLTCLTLNVAIIVINCHRKNLELHTLLIFLAWAGSIASFSYNLILIFTFTIQAYNKFATNSQIGIGHSAKHLISR